MNPLTKRILGLAACVAFAALHGPARAGQEGAVAIRGAAIMTAAGDPIESGTIVVRDGKIEAVGVDVDIPDDALLIDGTGMTVMPGMIDPVSRVGLGGGGASARGGRGGRRGRGRRGGFQLPTAAPSAGFSRAADIFYPYQRAYRTIARSGLTHLGLVPGGEGQAATIRLWADRPEQMIIQSEGLLFITVTNSTTSLNALRNGLGRATIQTGGEGRGGRAGRRGRRRGGRGESSAPIETQQRGRRGGRGGRGGGSSGGAPTELWAKVTAGETHLIVSASTPAAVAYLMREMKDYPEVKLAIQSSGSTFYQTLDLLAESKPTLILRPVIENKPNTQYRVNIPAMIHERGIPIAFTAGASLSASVDAPLFPIAYLVKTGLPREAALAALTTRPAEILGLSDRLGSIETGKDANLLLFDGDPFDPASSLTRVMVEGRFVYEK